MAKMVRLRTIFDFRTAVLAVLFHQFMRISGAYEKCPNIQRLKRGYSDILKTWSVDML